MTEQDWLTSSNPSEMLAEIENRANERQLRLFVAACCRSVLDLMEEPESRRVVELVLSCAGESCYVPEMQEAARLAGHLPFGRLSLPQLGNPGRLVRYYLSLMAEAMVLHDPAEAAARTVWSSANAVASAEKAGLWPAYTRSDPRPLLLRKSLLTEPIRQAHWLRDIIGNPYRDVRLNPSWLVHNDGTVLKMAQVIEANHSYDLFPILGDALEEAGCNNEIILAHCRSGSEHVEGCWLLEMLLQHVSSF